MIYPLLRRTLGSTTRSRSSPRRWRDRASPSSRPRPQPAKSEAPTAGSGWSSFSSLSTLPHRVFGEDLFDSLERFLGRRLRRHSVLHDVGPTGWPDMLVLHLRIGRIERPVIRDRRAEQRLGRIGFPMRVGEPPRVAFDDRRHAWNVAAEPGLQVLVHDLRLDQIFEEFLRYRDILRALRDHAAGGAGLARHRLAVVAERQT